jgi:hypothetical protein
MGTVGSFLGVKRTEREVDHSLPSRPEIKECVELYYHSLDTPSWRGAHLKHKDNFTFIFLCESVEYIQVDHDRVQWQVLVNTEMKLRVPGGEFLAQLSGYQLPKMKSASCSWLSKPSCSLAQSHRVSCSNK